MCLPCVDGCLENDIDSETTVLHEFCHVIQEEADDREDTVSILNKYYKKYLNVIEMTYFIAGEF